jgi:hypothetical protein
MRVISICIILSGMLYILGCQPTVDIEAEKAAIVAVNEKNMAAFVSRDYDGEAEVWAHEPYVVHAQGQFARVGWETISANYKTTFSRQNPNVVWNSMTASNYDIRLNGNIACVFYDQRTETTRNGEKRTNDAKNLKYFEKKNGQWKVIGVFPGETPASSE